MLDIKATGKAREVLGHIGLLAKQKGNIRMHELIKQTLRYQDACPRCGANWKTIPDMLHEGLGNMDFVTALTIITNCETCKIRFEDELKRLGAER